MLFYGAIAFLVCGILTLLVFCAAPEDTDIQDIGDEP